jgi:4-aminobutyrate aminotransferase
VQTGFGRTGAWFAADRYGVAPDAMCLAKAVGAGLPLAAVGAGRELMAALAPGDHGTTFGGSPLACAAALAGIAAMEDERLAERAAALGRRARRRLLVMAERMPRLSPPRGEGLMLGIELADPGTRLPRPDLAERAVREAERLGLVLLRSGPEGAVLRLLPPLVISTADLDLGLDALEAALAAAGAADPVPVPVAPLR